MQLVPIVDEGLGNSAYLVGLGDGRCLVVDPSRDPSPYLREAERRRWRIAFAAETHLHADFVSGSRELAAFGARVLAPAAARLRFDAHALDDGDEVDLGGLSLRVLATPGHTPEHVAYLLTDGGRQLGVFSGGTLIVGGVARPDLLTPADTEPLARAAYRSLHERLLALGDDVEVWPTHGAGSFCSTTPGAERTSTIGQERRDNPLLAEPDEDAFVGRLLGGLGSYPPYFLRLRAVNRAGARVYGPTPPTLASLPPGALRDAVDVGAEVVDVRPIAAFAAGHLPGSLSIALRPQFATWLGWLVDLDRPLVFVTEPGTDRLKLVRQCRKVGFERLLGELAGGVDAWQAAGLPLERTALQRANETDSAAAVLDVRQDSEWDDGHLPGAVHVELGALQQRGDAVPEGPVTVHCGHGERAMTAASLLARSGRRDVAVVAGGPDELARARRQELHPSV